MKAQNQKPSENEPVKVLQANKGSRAGAVVSVRLKPPEFELLAALSESRGRTLSETLRVGLHCLAYSVDEPIFQTGPPTRGDWAEAVVFQG